MTDEELRQAYDILMGDGNGAAWQTRVQTDIDPRTGVGVHTRPYEYSPQELQAAMDAGDEDNPWRAGLFNYILQNTGNPRMAVTGTNLAEYAPLVGTALAAKDAEIAVRDLPDAWREGNTADLLGNIAQIGLSGADAALTMAPFAKPIWKGGRNVVRNMGRRGPVPTMYSNPLMRTADDAASPAQEVARLLREGRASDVTDEMLAKFTPNDEAELFDLYQRGATGVDMPMDEASRMARADEMGFDTGTPLYHGTGADFQAFDAGRFQQSDFGTGGAGVYSSADAGLAGAYSDLVTRPTGEGANILPIVTRRNDAFDNGGYRNINSPEQAREYSRRMQELGVDNVYYTDAMTGEIVENTTFDPANIRSRFARFDPRLAHLRNLSAGVGGLGALGLLSMQPDRAQTEQDTRQYLGGLLQ